VDEELRRQGITQKKTYYTFFWPLTHFATPKSADLTIDQTKTLWVEVHYLGVVRFKYSLNIICGKFAVLGILCISVECIDSTGRYSIRVSIVLQVIKREIACIFD
jgi:hypothetical protein